MQARLMLRGTTTALAKLKLVESLRLATIGRKNGAQLFRCANPWPGETAAPRRQAHDDQMIEPWIPGNSPAALPLVIETSP
jgi:hypothetical protein